MRTPSLIHFGWAALISFAFPGPSPAQNTMKAVMNGTAKLTWIGLDFSEARFIPPLEFAEMDRSGPLYLSKWNQLLEQEPAKFDLCSALQRVGCVTNTSYVNAVNDTLDLLKHYAREPYMLDATLIPAMVKRYSTTGEGVGVVFIVSSFNKDAQTGDFHVTFFDMATREVLHTEKVTAKAVGFGLRNYWAGAIYGALKIIKNERCREWQQRFAR